MRTMPMRLLAGVALGAALMMSGCKSTPAPAPGVRNLDGSITNADGSVTYPKGTTPPTTAAAPAPAGPVKNADGSVTNPDGSVTYPPGTRRAKEEARESAANSVAPGAPATERAPVVHESRTIPSGTPVVVRVTETLSASRNNVGDRFTGVLDRPLMAGGSTIFERGTSVAGVVAAAKGKGRFKGAGDIGIEVTSIGRERVSTSEYEKSSPGRGKRTGEFAGGGAGLGAIIGGLAGGGKGALIGGLAGAGAGTAAGAYTGNRDVVIPSESVVTFELSAPITVR